MVSHLLIIFKHLPCTLLNHSVMASAMDVPYTEEQCHADMNKCIEVAKKFNETPEHQTNNRQNAAKRIIELLENPLGKL